MSDLWKHRSINMNCHTCMWYLRKPKIPTEIEVKANAALGRCRRRAPTLGGYPVVFETDWCGEHKLNENI